MCLFWVCGGFGGGVLVCGALCCCLVLCLFAAWVGCVCARVGVVMSVLRHIVRR